jgi:hypothetical protein
MTKSSDLPRSPSPHVRNDVVRNNVAASHVTPNDPDSASSALRIRFIRPASDVQRARRPPVALHVASSTPQDRWRWLPPNNWLVISEFLDTRSMIRLLQHSSTWLTRVVDNDPSLQELLCDLPMMTEQLRPIGEQAAATRRDVEHYSDSVEWGHGVNEPVRIHAAIGTFLTGLGGFIYHVVTSRSEASQLPIMVAIPGALAIGDGCGRAFRRWEHFALRRATARLASQTGQLRSGQRALMDRVFDAGLLLPRPEGQPERTLSWAIAAGDSALVRAGMRRLTELSPHHLPTLDLARLILGGNEPTLLQKYCASPMGRLCEAELAHYEAITTYVAELLCTPGFRAKHLLVGGDGAGLVDLALSPMPPSEDEFPNPTPRNPAVAAAILRGVQESHAPKKIKDAAMRALVGGREIAGDLVDIVAGDCELHAASRAPQWSGQMGRALRIHEGRELRLAIEAGSAEYVHRCTVEFASMRRTLPAREWHQWLAGMVVFLSGMCREPMLEDPAAVHRSFRGVMAFIQAIFGSAEFTGDEKLSILRGANAPLGALGLKRNPALAAAIARGIRNADAPPALVQQALAVAFGQDADVELALEALARECEARLAAIDPPWATALAAELRSPARTSRVL